MVASLLLAACGGGATDTKVPSSITVTPTAVTLNGVGQTQQLTAVVTDQDGATIASPSITWATNNGGVASVTSSGLVSAVGNGSATITATAGAVNATSAVSVMQTPAQVQKAAGDQQTANVGQTVTTPLTVQVNDAAGHPVQGITVGFTVEAQLGTLGTPTGVTGADGRVATSLTIVGAGPIPVTATVANTTLSTIFSETGQSPFSIELQFLTSPTPAEMNAFEAARHRWEGLIVGDLPNVLLSEPAGTCGPNSPAINRQVDDVLILVTIEPIDGPGNVIGAATPCLIRVIGRLPVLGFMKFDVADLDALESSGLLKTVVIHEMGHVLGFGTIWNDSQLPGSPLLVDPSCAGPSNNPCSTGHHPHFTGSHALAAFNSAGGLNYTSNDKVPVEDTTLVGTADSHWRESVFDTELMTGFVDSSNPLSRVTIASMQDLGYSVSFAGADPYSLPSFTPALRAFAHGPHIMLRNDLLRLPIRVVDPTGRVVKIIQP